uniref:Uncharacterized protein n=1 Tax=Caenorhabditis japonica TaxID=281687 RepID=A0A8R1DQX2_CAEJA
MVRSKRQQCRCVKNPNGGLTCSCAKGPANGSSSSTTSAIGTGVQHDVPQSADIANQLTAISQQSSGLGNARCGCIQIVFQGAPQYNCQCGDQNGNPLPTTTKTSTTTTTTPAPTTTSTTTTTTTTPAPVSNPQVPTNTQGSNNNGACNCIMISITSPQSAQYQCQCAQPQQQQQQQVTNTTNNTSSNQEEVVHYDYDELVASQTAIPGTLPPPPTTTTSTTTSTITSTTTASPPNTVAAHSGMYTASPPTVYPAIGQLATGQETCYCLDPSTSVMSGCGCRCNCATLMVTVPNAYCGCPQPGMAQYAEAYDYTQVFSTQAPTTQPPTTTTEIPTTTTSTTTIAPASQQVAYDQSATQYPLTTTCVMYVNVPTTACSCLPQYDQCAQNVCCLKAKYRSYKKTEESSPSTIDMLMNVLQTIKTKLE